MVPALLTALVALNAPLAVELDASTELRLFRRAWLPVGFVDDPELHTLLHNVARVRVQGGDSPWQTDALSAELAAWFDAGALAEPTDESLDGDLQSAWVQHQTRATRFRFGRQLTTVTAARFARFDGLAASVTAGRVQVDGYGGYIALPRWNRPRGYYLLGDDTTMLREPTLADDVSRSQRWLGGASLALTPVDRAHASLSVHEEHDRGAVAFRRVAADGRIDFDTRTSTGGRLIVDAMRREVADAQAYVDAVLVDDLTSALDYAFQAPERMLPATSIFSVFDTSAWHELGAELGYTGVAGMRLTARGATQLYEEGTPGARAALRAVVFPESGLRWRIVAELQRLLAASRGYVLSRAALAYRPDDAWTLTADLAVYLYDRETNGISTSAVALASLERILRRGLVASVAGSVSTTPYVEREAQVMARLSVALDPLEPRETP